MKSNDYLINLINLILNFITPYSFIIMLPLNKFNKNVVFLSQLS